MDRSRRLAVYTIDDRSRRPRSSQTFSKAQQIGFPMDDEQIQAFVARHQENLREEFRYPNFDGFNQRSPIPLPSTVRAFFALGERLCGSCFKIDCGNMKRICVQNFCPLNLASIAACERSGWRFVELGLGCDGEEILVSLEEMPMVFVGWSTFSEPPHELGFALPNFIESLVRLLDAQIQ